MNKKPYISFIGFARNDDYVPDRAERHNFSLQTLINQIDEYKIPSEIIIVEWNYLQNNPPLAEVIKIKSFSEWTKLRVIRVPPRFHQKYKFWQSKPFHVGAAVNVGIQRALGDFVLPIASDIFLSDTCLEMISKQALDENTFYRCDRYDILPTALDRFDRNGSRHELFKIFDQHIKIRHHQIIQSADFLIADLHTNGCGDFCLVSKKQLLKIRGFKEGKDAGGLDIDSLVIHALHGMGCDQKLLSDEYKVYKISHNNSSVNVINTRKTAWQQSLERFMQKINYSPSSRVNMRILFNYPRRFFTYAPQVNFDSFEKNFVKPARRWAQKRPPFSLNNVHWGLINEKLEESCVDFIPPTAQISQELNVDFSTKTIRC